MAGFWQKREGETNELNLHKVGATTIFIRQFKSPFLVILFIATGFSFFLGERTDSIVIFSIILFSIGLGFTNEYRAEKTVSDLLKKISVLATVIRNGEKLDIPAKEVRLNDTVLLTPGSIIPADLELISFKNLEVDESALSGESAPVIKGEKDKKAFLGTVVSAGSGSGTVVAIGRNTRFGKISLDLSQAKPETEFQKGLRDFGVTLVRLIVIMAVLIFLVNFLLGKPPVDAVLFSLAIAIGLTPELLPMVVTISMSHGARILAKKEVVVKRLIAIEDLGNMEVLCTDKTGTLTEGKIVLESHFDLKGEKSGRVLELSLWCNSAIVHHRIFGDAIDKAIWEYAQKENITPSKDIEKIDEESFDFNHRAMFAVISQKGQRLFIVKGAPEEVLKMSRLIKSEKNALLNKFHALSREGYRVIALASRKIESKNSYSFANAKGLHFEGFLTFSDQIKKTAPEAIKKLAQLGVKIKIITGDNELVTRHVCEQVGIESNEILLGSQVDLLSEEKLQQKVWQLDVFARMSPEQKERVIKALQVGDHAVGFLGDGINDGPALHLSDIGISVNTGVDVAKDSASVVLLRKSLSVIADGVIEGRKIFNNTIKYILMGTSSNFGNMFSAAGASFLLPFLPMTPSQILLTNVLYDVSQLSIPTDNVDAEQIVKPKKWDVNLIKRYMFFFGPISSVYDYLTFGIMIFIFHAQGALFQTGWFIESLVTEIFVIFIIRTARRFYKSRPSGELLLVCVGIVALGILLPFSPFAHILSFVAPPPLYFVILIVLTITYLGLIELLKPLVIKNAQA